MKFLTAFLLATCVFVQTPTAFASSTQDLQQQVEAISDYIKYAKGTASPLTSKEMRKIILAGASFAVTAQEKTGHFGYEYLPIEDVYRKDDNMIRQAGTLFMLSEVYKLQSQKDPSIATAIEKSIGYFKSLTIKGRSVDGNFSCIKNSAGAKVCSLGTTSLALIGILNYIEVHPEKKKDYADVIKQYENYLVTARFKNAGYSGRYTLSNGFGKEESAFYNGEAMLALVKYYQYQPEESVKKLLLNSFVYLDSDANPDPNLYLWIMAALKDMQRLWPQTAFVTYTSEFTNTRLSTARALHQSPRNHCALYEGLTSAASILKNTVSDTDLSQLNKEIEFGLARSAYLQVDTLNPYRLTLTEGKVQLQKISNLRLAKGGFLTATNETSERIDFTQHCVSSYLQKMTAIDGMKL